MKEVPGSSRHFCFSSGFQSPDIPPSACSNGGQSARFEPPGNALLGSSRAPLCGEFGRNNRLHTLINRAGIPSWLFRFRWMVSIPGSSLSGA